MSGNYPAGMTAATLLPGEYFSVAFGRLIDEGPDCPICGHAMEIVADTQDEFAAECHQAIRCEECAGAGEVPSLCSRHEDASWRLPDGQCGLCFAYGLAPGVYDETCGACEGEGFLRCEGSEARSRYDI